MSNEDTTAPTKPLRPRGKALKRSERALDRLAKVTRTDHEAAQALWEASAGPKFKKLLQAK